jgi:hypothetical protein
MKRPNHGLLKTGLPILIAASFLAACQNESTISPEPSAPEAVNLAKQPPVVPAIIEVPAGNRLAFATFAEGVQIYQCALTATGYAWVFVAPEAVLLEGNNGVVGSHYVGPTWETNSGSNVVGTRLQGITQDPSAIAWLLLGAVSSQGPGILDGVTYIQRVSTTGGLAPTSGADSSSVGEYVNVPYTADYFFYKAH